MRVRRARAWMLVARAGLPARGDQAHRGNGRELRMHASRAHRGGLPEGSSKTRTLIGAVWKRGNTLS